MKSGEIIQRLPGIVHSLAGASGVNVYDERIDSTIEGRSVSSEIGKRVRERVLTPLDVLGSSSEEVEERIKQDVGVLGKALTEHSWQERRWSRAVVVWKVKDATRAVVKNALQDPNLLTEFQAVSLRRLAPVLPDRSKLRQKLNNLVGTE